jgi:lipopolysaccharide transport system permease protein
MNSLPVAPGADVAADRVRIDSQRHWFPDLFDVLRYRHLIYLLSRRDITVRYRQTVLGMVWIFAGPLVSAGLFSFVFGRVADLPSGGVPYFVFSYAGLLAWNLFSGVLSGTSGSVVSNSALLTKIYFPRLVFPLCTLAWALFNTVVSFGVMLVLLVVYGIGFSLQLLLLPFWLLLAIMLALALGLVLSASSVWYRDVGYATPILTSLLLYISPVAYSIDAVPSDLRNLFLLNPLTTVVEGCRWSLLGQASLSAWAIVYTVAVAVIGLVVGTAVFTRLESGFTDVI